jgi:hypothetical protein
MMPQTPFPAPMMGKRQPAGCHAEAILRKAGRVGQALESPRGLKSLMERKG